MRFNKILTFAVIAAISASFVSCSDDDDDDKKVTPAVLPMSIINSDETDGQTVTFTYGTGNDSTLIKSYRVTEKGENFEHITNYEITYGTAGLITELKETSASGETLTYTYSYSNNVPKNTKDVGPTFVNVKKMLGAAIIEDFVINGSKQLVSKTELDDSGSELLSITPTSSYTYSNKNLSTITSAFETTTLAGIKLWHNNRNGVFKDVTTPQWFLMIQLDDFDTPGQLQNNVSKVEYKSFSVDQTGKTKTETSYTNYNYTSYIQDFPSKYTITEDDGDIQNCVVTYNITK